MRKRVFGRKLGRNRNSRKALLRSLVRALVREGSIVTTRAKAKAVQPMVDKLMTKVGKSDLASRRAVLAKLGNDKQITDKLFKDYSQLTVNRKSGFTRIILLPSRKGDNAELVRLEWVESPKVVKKAKEKKK